jgi:DNA gyrase/topoisomerase IV subunit B
LFPLVRCGISSEQSLNVEDNTEGLRYEKVILATDADVDGMHPALADNGSTTK